MRRVCAFNAHKAISFYPFKDTISALWAYLIRIKSTL